MKKYAAVRRMIRFCGRNVKLVMEATGEIKNVRAVIQPLRYRNNANAGGIYLPPGFSDLENYLYLGPADKPLDPYRKAGYVEANGESYLIRRTQRVYFEDQCVYVWAILQKRHEEE